mgnify:CR=1 FL=1
MHNILAITDRAVAAYLENEDIQCAVYPFKRAGAKEIPCVIVHCSRATPLSPFDATCEIDCAVMVRTTAATEEDETEDAPVSANDTLIDAVQSALHKFGDGRQSGTGLADAITTAGRGAGFAAFTCQNVEVVSLETNVDRDADMAFTDTITLRLVACPADVS